VCWLKYTKKREIIRERDDCSTKDHKFLFVCMFFGATLFSFCSYYLCCSLLLIFFFVKYCTHIQTRCFLLCIVLVLSLSLLMSLYPFLLPHIIRHECYVVLFRLQSTYPFHYISFQWITYRQNRKEGLFVLHRIELLIL